MFSFETEVCVELELGAVDVTAVVQAARIADAEGGADSVGFLTGAALSADALLGHVRSIAHYDEGATVAGPLKVGVLFSVHDVNTIRLVK